jgi:two-component system NarL family sensor kinase
MIMYVVLQKRKQFRHKLEKQELEHTFQNELLQTRLEVQEQSLKYFSEEIHDNVGQILSIAKLHLYKIAKNTTDASIQTNAKQGTELLTKAISDLRTISHTANGGMVLNADLEESIQKELSYITSAKNINCTFNTRGDSYHLGQEKNLLLFRIVQESIANALKHGDPRSIDIDLEYQPEKLIVSIADDGVGFDVNEKKADAGMGLSNMSTRIALLQGNLAINSVKGEGTTIKLNIPRT